MRSSGHPVPLDMNILKALKRSSLGLDWYLWLTYRTFALRSVRFGSLGGSLYRQFGADTRHRRATRKYREQAFRTKDCLRELKKIKIGLAGAELRDSQGRADPLALEGQPFPGSAAAFNS